MLIVIGVITGLVVIKMSYSVYVSRYKTKLLRINPKLFYNQKLIYVDENENRFTVKLLFSFSYNSYAIEFDNGTTKTTSVFNLEIQ